MALMRCHMFSETLGLDVPMNVVLPERRHGWDGTTPLPTLFLLHGHSDDHSAWTRYTSIERYAVQAGLAVVMPEVGRSFYTDMAHGLPYWSYISEEMPALARAYFPLSDRREDTFVAGLSMGGYGAFKLAMRRPELAAAAASLSGALDPQRDAGTRERLGDRHLKLIFGDLEQVGGDEDDLFHLAERLAGSGADRPALWQCSGTADFVYEQNTRFRDHARQLGLELTYEEHEGWGHTWSYWDMMVQQVIDWLPMRSRPSAEREAHDGRG